jgi:hypothetical protein
MDVLRVVERKSRYSNLHVDGEFMSLVVVTIPGIC